MDPHGYRPSRRSPVRRWRRMRARTVGDGSRHHRPKQSSCPPPGSEEGTEVPRSVTDPAWQCSGKTLVPCCQTRGSLGASHRSVGPHAPAYRPVEASLYFSCQTGACRLIHGKGRHGPFPPPPLSLSSRSRTLLPCPPHCPRSAERAACRPRALRTMVSPQLDGSS